MNYSLCPPPPHTHTHLLCKARYAAVGVEGKVIELEWVNKSSEVKDRTTLKYETHQQSRGDTISTSRKQLRVKQRVVECGTREFPLCLNLQARVDNNKLMMWRQAAREKGSPTRIDLKTHRGSWY